LPTILPPSRRAPKKSSLARKTFDVTFNTALVVSALILTFIVLMREQQYAFEPPDRMSQAFEQTVQPPLDPAGERMVIPPST
jgi:hypothetical protein